MVKPSIEYGLALAVLFSLSACASTSSMRNEPLTAGTQRTFEADFDQVVNAARDAVVASGLAIDDAYQAKENVFVIIAKKGGSAWSWGEYVRVTIEGTTDGASIVRILTKRKLATNVTARSDWSDTVFSNIDLQLRDM